MRTPDSTTKQKIVYRVLSVLIILSVLAFCGFLLKAYFEGKFNSVESLQEYVAGFGAFGPVFLLLMQMVRVVVPVLPGFLGCIVGGILYGPVVGFLCNYIGIGTGSIAAFFVARKFGTKFVQNLFPAEKYQRWAHRAATSKSYTSFLFAAMILPLFPDDFLCYFTGLTKMTAKRFSWIIILGKPWCILAYSIGFSLIR